MIKPPTVKISSRVKLNIYFPPWIGFNGDTPTTGTVRSVWGERIQLHPVSDFSNLSR